MKLFITTILCILLSSCTMVNVDIGRSYCPNYRNSLGADVRINMQNGSNIYIPVSCIRID